MDLDELRQFDKVDGTISRWWHGLLSHHMYPKKYIPHSRTSTEAAIATDWHGLSISLASF